MTDNNPLAIQALVWTGKSLKVLDQRQLPEVTLYEEFNTADEIFQAIRTMRVRGAPAIGIAAGYAVALSVMQHWHDSPDNWRAFVRQDIEKLSEARPTAVNLHWALNRMSQLLSEDSDDPVLQFITLAERIHKEDIEANQTMGELGADVLEDAIGLMTHCNTGALATGGYGTALGVIRSAYRRKARHIYAGETRPWLQGARLTVWELAKDGIPSTLIADSSAAWLMKSGAIDWVIVGADRIAENGDTANKIGTYGLAVQAQHHGVKLMVVAPTSTIDWSIANGKNIKIEERTPEELLPACYLQKDSSVTAWNPVFDVTPVEMIAAIVTEKGVVMNPAQNGLGDLR